MANERRCALSYRQRPPSRLHVRPIATSAEFRRVRGIIGDWNRLPSHPDQLAALVNGVLSQGLMRQLTYREMSELANGLYNAPITPVLLLRQCVNMAFLANALARAFRNTDDGLRRRLYYVKAKWVEQAVFRAIEDEDDRLSWHLDGSPDAVVVDFTEIQHSPYEPATLGFHVLYNQIRQDAPQLAAILFGS